MESGDHTVMDDRGGSPPAPGTRLVRFRAAFGPGLLWAAAAIGVSHLVQSTRAGALAGGSLVWLVLLAMVLKYPFFEYGPRYAAATGESLVEGYRRLGRWALGLYLAITLATTAIVLATVSLFTTFLFAYLLGVEWPLPLTGALVLGLCGFVLWFGRFRGLDATIKVVLALLALSTLMAAALAVPRTEAAAFTPWPFIEGADVVSFAFLLALVGWMPSALDSAVWSSLWTLAKNRVTGVRVTVAEALADFRIGYAGTGVIALAFLALGAGVMHPTGESFSPEGTVFSLQLVDLYGETLGGWTRPVVLVAAVTAMFSTTLTVMDGFPRALARSFHVLFRGGIEGAPAQERAGAGYWGWLLVLSGLTVGIFAGFVGTLTDMVDFTTIVAFITAPVLGWLNLRAVTAEHVPGRFRPSRGLRALSYVGLVLLGGTAVVFLVTLVG